VSTRPKTIETAPTAETAVAKTSDAELAVGKTIDVIAPELGNRRRRRESDTGGAESQTASEQSACYCGKASVTQHAAAEQSASQCCGT